jgi:predicted alpha/beta superfamily hydrolase
LFVIETLLVEPELFDTYVAFDPSLWWNNANLLTIAAKRFAEVMTKSAPVTLKWHYEPLPDEKHSTIYHPAALRAFRMLFKPSPE